MSKIHPTAIIDPGAQIASDVQIGPYSVIGSDVILKEGVILHSHVVVDGKTTIGEGTEVFPFAVVGGRAQDKKYAGEKGELIIGKNNSIREHATLNPGTLHGGMKTVIGDNNLLMIATHVAHDCHLGNNIIMANNATLGGHVQVGDYAVIGGLAAVHQFIRIGEYAVIGGMSGVESDVIPYGRVKGERASLAGLNLVGLERAGFSKDKIKTLQKAYHSIFKDEGLFDERLDKAGQEFKDEETVSQIIDFAKKKDKFPICQPRKKAL